LRYRLWLAEGRTAIKRSNIVLIFAVALIALSLVTYEIELLDPSVILVLGMTSSNWWGMVTGIPVHALNFYIHLLPNIITLLLATAIYIVMFQVNLFEQPKRSAAVSCTLATYGTILGSAALFLVLPPNSISFGMSGVILGLGGIDLSLAVAGLVKASNVNNAVKKLTGIGRWQKGPFDNFVTFNMMAYLFIALLFIPTFQPVTIRAGQLTLVSGAMVHLVAFGVGFAVGLPYFGSLKARRYQLE
jgi:hypothetical protein